MTREATPEITYCRDHVSFHAAGPAQGSQRQKFLSPESLVKKDRMAAEDEAMPLCMGGWPAVTERRGLSGDLPVLPAFLPRGCLGRSVGGKGSQWLGKVLLIEN